VSRQLSDVRSLAVLADVHGNLPALEAVLADVADVAPDRVVVNGDLVNRGPEGVSVLERVAATGWPVTLGNHDDLVRMWIERDGALPASWFDDPFWCSTAWCAERLAEAGWLSWLAARPMTVAVEPSDAPRVLVSHGSPRHYREGYGRHLTDAAISEIVEMHPYDVLVGSHTHQPMERRWGRHLVLNTGAVGTPFNRDARAQYLLLRRHGASWRPEFRRVPYDREAALAAFDVSGFLVGGGLSARIYWLEAATARSFLVPFLMWAEERGVARDEDGWARFRRDRLGSVSAPDDAGAAVLPRTELL
jgi:predicted phosphodiesterase